MGRNKYHVHLIISEKTYNDIKKGDYRRFMKYALRHIKKLEMVEVEHGLEKEPEGSKRTNRKDD